MNHLIPPGSTIGVLGSGQLGRMFAMSARRLGYRVHVLSPDDDTPTGQIADVEIQAPYEDLEAVRRFASQVDVVTFEFENVPAETIQTVDRSVAVRPAGHILHTTQQRLREKTFLQSAGMPVTSFQPIRSLEQLKGLGDDAFPAVLKTTAWGYDGKGQVRIQSRNEVEAAWTALNGQEAILEQWVEFECELSIVAARGQEGDFVSYGPIINRHHNHILDVSVVPSELPAKIGNEAIEIARTILDRLEVIGVLCVEFFLTQDHRLLVNELAPRPHNSGHLTIDAHTTSQFEQQVRAVCGLPLGAATPLRPAAMANLLGDLWQENEPRWHEAIKLPDVKLHLYGKKRPLVGRKMGHLTALADSPAAAKQRVLAAREALGHSRGAGTRESQKAHVA